MIRIITHYVHIIDEMFSAKYTRGAIKYQDPKAWHIWRSPPIGWLVSKGTMIGIQEKQSHALKSSVPKFKDVLSQMSFNEQKENTFEKGYTKKS